MKKNLKCIVSLLLLTTMLVCVLTACTTKLSGTYTNDEGIIKQSFTFKEDNKVEVLLLVSMLKASTSLKMAKSLSLIVF